MATAPTFVGVVTSGATSSSPISVGIPAGVAAGDLLVAALTSSGGSVSSVPLGWVLVTSRVESDGTLYVYTKVAGASEPTPEWGVTPTNWRATLAAYRGPSGVAGSFIASGVSSATLEAPSLPFTHAATTRLALFAGYSYQGNISFTTPAGMVERSDAPSALTVGLSVNDESYTAPGNTGARIATSTPTLSRWFAATLTMGVNSGPNAPVLLAPADASTIDRNVTQRFDWDFSDPDAGDSQSKYDLHYRVVGATSWTEVTGTTPNTYRDITSGTFVADDYEWQVRTYDAQGEQGPWSSSSFFTAGDVPTPATITHPTNGGTVSASESVTWSADTQQAYQVRTVADNAGSPDTATVYYDSGQVTSTTARSHTVAFPVNDRYEHVQVRVEQDGLWSAWASVRVLVSYTPPPTPTVSLSADDSTGILNVAITNPNPGAGEPSTSYNDVYLDDGDGEFRAATLVVPNSTWTYWLPKSGRDYAGNVRVVAVGDNGTTASSN